MTIDINVHHHHHFPPAPADPRQDQVIALLHQLKQQGAQHMASLADITAAVQAEKTVEDGVITLLQTISADLAAALASNDPAAMQAVVDMVQSNTAALSAAVTANTPATPAAPAAPAP